MQEQIFYNIVNKKRRDKLGLEGIALKKTKSKLPYRYIEIAKWNQWHTSLWVKFVSGKDNIIVDSSVIKELYVELLRLEKELKKG